MAHTTGVFLFFLPNKGQRPCRCSFPRKRKTPSEEKKNSVGGSPFFPPSVWFFLSPHGPPLSPLPFVFVCRTDDSFCVTNLPFPYQTSITRECVSLRDVSKAMHPFAKTTRREPSVQANFPNLRSFSAPRRHILLFNHIASRRIPSIVCV
jgi:hypothetical protein